MSVAKAKNMAFSRSKNERTAIGARRQHWHPLSELLPPLPFLHEMEFVKKAIEAVWPLNARHRRSLPQDIRELSAALTFERSQLKTPYWQRPAFISAYLYYFLPWNIIRLGRLFAGLALPEPQLRDNLVPALLDAGTGPLTLPMALWLARPEWRKKPVQIVALDSARQPVALGKKIFETLAKSLNCKPWSIKVATGPLQSLSRHLPAAASFPWLVTAANVLNEQQIGMHGRQLADVEDWEENEADAWNERFSNLLTAWEPLLSDAPLLAVEPGTRLGGGGIMRLRQAALEFGLFPESPCTHAKICPLLETGASWCHFVFSANDAPEWLKELAREARLFKTSLSLSTVLLARKKSEKRDSKLMVRVISQSFEARGGISRYGCAACGLCLLPDARRLVSGSLCQAVLPAKKTLDEKSGAIIVTPAP